MTTGCGKIPKLQNGQELVAKIDGKQISAEELYKEMKKQAGTNVMMGMIDSFIANKEIKTDEDVKAYADSQLEQLKLQYQQAGEDFQAALTGAGYKNEAAFKDVIMLDYKKNKVVENYVKAKITDKEIEEYYKDEIFGELTVRHILIKPDTTTGMTDEQVKKAEEEALKKAKDLIAQIQKGSKFEDLAKANSDDDGTKENGGLLSGFAKDEVVPEFWDASYKLKNGEYTTTPVKSTYGYHIILKVSAKDKPKLEDVKDTVIDKIFSKKQAADTNLNAKIWSEVRKKYNLNIVDSDIKDSYNSNITVKLINYRNE
jgi:foldase protein PrsA